jgi:membrane-anchored glycerophosphoryl diester phosphodiesterase (GDPDase)
MDEIEKIQAELSQLEGQEGGLASTTHATIRKLETWRRSKDRSFIVKWIVFLYVFSIAICVLYLAGRGLFGQEDVFDSLSEVIKVAVLPVLTLVIGYYFGTAKTG